MATFKKVTHPEANQPINAEESVETSNPVSASFYDFRSWVIAAYPDDEKQVKEVPVAILKGLYPEIAKLGPAAPRFEDIQSTLHKVKEEYGMLMVEKLLATFKPLAIEMMDTRDLLLQEVELNMGFNQDLLVNKFCADLGLWREGRTTIFTGFGFLVAAATFAAFPELSKSNEYSHNYRIAVAYLRTWEHCISPNELAYQASRLTKN